MKCTKRIIKKSAELVEKFMKHYSQNICISEKDSLINSSFSNSKILLNEKVECIEKSICSIFSHLKTIDIMLLERQRNQF